ncbi:MAPEG family [Seminavis robusta]|uniref:MAPEG family n=1 Tax=Seminavis robusta TaxID=568900 RepID=A0A9N8DFS1_9STRA|nr:MAPEG family [Seminavis robusta]|eukprot:Sro120_g058430.1 MAPEG family (140) ;mRNA; r:40522-40941
MVLDMKSSHGAVVGFGLWTFGHIGVLAVYRTTLILKGDVAPNGFGPSRDDSSKSFIGRVGRSHANCTENFPLFLATVVLNTLTGGPDISSLSWYYVCARMGHSTSHCLGDTDIHATIRFLFFGTQIGLLGNMLYKTIKE